MASAPAQPVFFRAGDYDNDMILFNPEEPDFVKRMAMCLTSSGEVGITPHQVHKILRFGQ